LARQHIWLPLQGNWIVAEFASYVQRQSLAIVTAAPPFGVDEAAPHAVRISLGAASSRCELVRALEVVAAALKSSGARTRVI
jgi:DNA-binding transcriptional MocR family regulator